MQDVTEQAGYLALVDSSEISMGGSVKRVRAIAITQLAITCGFAHQSHLTRHFKRLTGVTPKNFLKS